MKLKSFTRELREKLILISCAKVSRATILSHEKSMGKKLVKYEEKKMQSRKFTHDVTIAFRKTFDTHP